MDALERELARKRREESLALAAHQLRRGQHTAAVAQCQALLAADPDDLDARELLGDVFAAQARWDFAMAEFQRVLRADPGRVSAERKLAEASLGRAGLKGAAFAAEEDGTPRQPRTASLLSLLFPGLGQMYNGQLSKGVGAFLGGLTLAFFVIWSLVLLPIQAVNASLGGRRAPVEEVLARYGDVFVNMGVGLKALLLVACVLWLCLHLWSIIDAATSARRRVPGLDER
jgi:tetratricopeptide (TPR) repeat protein